MAGRPPPDSRGLQGLVDIVDRLLAPDGCPWDRAQTHASLKPHLLEECYEALEAIDSGDDARLREELGDLLLQPVLHAQIERAAGGWGIDEVADAIREKLVRRHPHVFGDVAAADADAVLQNWDRIKRAESDGERSVLAGVPRTLPALSRAMEVSKRAARCGFEWPGVSGVLDKLAEEERELRDALDSGDAERVADEVGDLLFTVVNVARWAGVDAEDALRRMVDRFAARFVQMERAAAKPLADLTAEEWDTLWRAAKEAEATS